MAAVPLSYRATLYDLVNKRSMEVFLDGEAFLTGLSIGGGPILPSQPPSWGPGGPPHPAFPIAGGPDPGWPDKPGYPPYVSGGPIIPPNVPPGLQPPTPPNPGDPTTIVPPPAGSAGWPVQAIAVPPYMIVNYPGVGPVVVAPPATQPA